MYLLSGSAARTKVRDLSRDPSQMNHHFVWLVWSSAFLVPWIAVYYASPRLRDVMWRASAATAVFGLSEPIFEPA